MAQSASLGTSNEGFYPQSASCRCESPLGTGSIENLSHDSCLVKPALHDANTDTNTNILADILARIAMRMSVSRSACDRNNFRKSCMSDVSA